MGVVKATIYVDTSFNSGCCQSGYYIYFKDIQNPYVSHTSVYESPDNNSAEVMGILKASQVAVHLYRSLHPRSEKEFEFIVHNDNITAVTVSDSNYTPSKKANGKFKSTIDIKAWCMENKVTLKCIRKKRNDPIMKKCDKLSKSYRKEGKGGVQT